MMISADHIQPNIKERARWRFRLSAVVLLVLITVGGAHANEQSYTGPYLVGRLLVAEESMPDARFRESVILILEHDASGAFGVVLNRPIGEGPLGNLMAGFGMKPSVADEATLSMTVDLRNGGPVERGRAVVVHSTDYHANGSHLAGKVVSWTLESSVLRAVAAGGGPDAFLVFMGYAGWGDGQLEKEIGRGDWLDSDATSTLIFDTPVEEIYETARGAAGLSL